MLRWCADCGAGKCEKGTIELDTCLTQRKFWELCSGTMQNIKSILQASVLNILHAAKHLAMQQNFCRESKVAQSIIACRGAVENLCDPLLTLEKVLGHHLMFLYEDEGIRQNSF